MRAPLLRLMLTVAVCTVGLASAHFPDSLWERIPVGATVVHPHSSRSLELVIRNASDPHHRRHRSLAAASVNINEMVPKINAFFSKIASASISALPDLGKDLAALDYRALNPKYSKAKGSGDDSTKSLIKDNGEIVKVTTENIQKLSKSLERAALATALRDITSAVSSAWNTITADGGRVRGCGIYKGMFSQRMSQLASMDLPADDKEPFEALQASVRVLVTAMTMVTALRQTCDTFGEVDPVTDIKLIFEVLIKAAKLQKLDDSGIKDAKNGLQSDKGAFGNRTQAFQDTIKDYLKGKKDMYENVGDLFKTDVWQMAVNGNSAAADASAVFAATLLTRHDQFSNKLTNLESDIRGNSAERVRELGKADQKIEEFHAKKTQQISTMTRKFGDQHAERSGRLQNIDTRVQGINTFAKGGFQDVQRKLNGLEGKIGGVIDGVADIIKNDAALTTRELKEKIAETFQYTRGKIGVINEKVSRHGDQIQVALENTKTLLHDGFDKTNRVLVASSERMSSVMVSSFQVLRSAVVDAAQRTQDVVSSRVIANGAKLSEQLVEFNYKLEYVEGRLVVLADQVSTLNERLQVTNQILQDLAASAELVGRRAREPGGRHQGDSLPAGVRGAEQSVLEPAIQLPELTRSARGL
ncbi:hypothetical protein PINS_up004331 [Pythium insidiosum]|nr:hypothetical protein PINS_up004331 [Pythium insidiosum]